jgi:dihydrofolate synthase/folylpolyglutamate synthase
MVGRHQAQNAILALEALRRLVPDVPPRVLADAVGAVEVPGRFQRVDGPAGVLLLDVGHNPDALDAFAVAAADAYPGREVRAFVGMLRDKDLAGSLAQLAPAVRPPLLVGSAASAPPGRLLRRADWLRVPATDRRASAWVGSVARGLALLERWQAAGEGRIAAVVGSFTSVGEAMERLGVDPLRG